MTGIGLLALIDHMEWADARTWTAMSALPKETLAASDLRERWFHIHLVQQIYLSLWRRRPLATIPEGEEYPDLTAVRRFGQDFYAGARAVIEEADAARLEEPVVVPFSERAAPPGKSITHATFAETVVQVAMHTTHHRGQLATRIRELGGTPRVTDFVIWVWQGRPVPEWPASSPRHQSRQ